jgi:hypothetical protein
MTQQTRKNGRRTCGQFVQVRIVDCCRESHTRRNVTRCHYEAGQISWRASGVHLVHQDAKFVGYATQHRQPMKVLQYRSHVVTRMQTTNESGGCIVFTKLLYKVQCYGVSGRLLAWLSAFVTGRSQCVVVDDVHSSYVDVISGVPQSSVLGPFHLCCLSTTLILYVIPALNLS